MFSTPMAAFEAYLNGNNEALILIEENYTSLLEFINKQEPYSLSQKINYYLSDFCSNDLVDLNFYKEGDFWTLDILTTFYFDALEEMPFNKIFPLIEKVKIININATNSPLSVQNNKHFLELCPHLKSLSISDKHFEKVYKLKQLESLHIHSNSNLKINAAIANLMQLKSLKLVCHYYIELDKNIALLKDLESFEYYVFNNDIGNNILDLSRENLQKDLTYLAACPKLKSLAITLDEYIKSLPELGLFKKLEQLYLYNISHRFVDVLPEILAECTNLNKVYVCLQAIPQNTKNLDNSIALLNEKYDFSFEANTNAHDGKKYFSLVNTYY